MNLGGSDVPALLMAYGYVLLFLVVLLEEAGLPLPLPGDLLLLYVGSLVTKGALSFGVAIGVVVTATLLGTSILYSLARRGGRPLLARYGRLLRINNERLARAERWLGRRVLIRLVGLRLVPGLRVYSTMAAGVLMVPRRHTTLSFAISGAIWACVWIGLGALLGPQVAVIGGYLQRFSHLAGVVLGGGILIVGGAAVARLLLGRAAHGHPGWLSPVSAASVAFLVLIAASLSSASVRTTLRGPAGWVERDPDLREIVSHGNRVERFCHTVLE